MLYKPKNFKLEELVPHSVFVNQGERAWERLDPYALYSLQQLHDKFGRIRINNWADGGNRDEAGFRTWDSPTGAKLSMHRFGRAFDPQPLDVTPHDIYMYVLAHPDEFEFINAVENIVATPTWVHFDTRNGAHRIWVVNP